MAGVERLLASYISKKMGESKKKRSRDTATGKIRPSRSAPKQRGKKGEDIYYGKHEEVQEEIKQHSRRKAIISKEERK